MHAITALTIEKRLLRSLPLAEKLEAFGLHKLVTSGEASFYLTGNEGKRYIQHLKPDQSRKDAEVMPNKNHAQGVMVWAATSDRGVIGPIFVESGAKINSQVYIDMILTPALESTRELYPENDYLWHQDSAPSHVSKMATEFLEKNGVTFISKDEWLPSSPDYVACDYFLWGYVKWRVKRRSVKSLSELKVIIQEEFLNIPHKMITRAINSVPQRLREVHAASGGHLKLRL